jgi:hypothetical protein
LTVTKSDHDSPYRAQPLKLAVGAVVTLVVVAAVVVLLDGLVGYPDWMRQHGGCSTGWPANQPTWPYGQVESCRSLKERGHLLGDADATAYVLLQTSTGRVALKIDYSDLSKGRQYVAKAAELTPEQAPSLTEAEKQDLARDIRSRGGARNGTWTLIYGDG